MSSIAMLLPSEQQVIHKVENNTLVTSYGSFRFHNILSYNDELSSTVLNLPALVIYQCIQKDNERPGSLAAKTLECSCQGPQSICSAEYSSCSYNVIDLNRDSYIDVDTHGVYRTSDTNTLSREECVQKLNSPMSTQLRVTQADNIIMMIEVDLSFGSDELRLRDSLDRFFRNLGVNADYVPYRDTALTKLLWSWINGGDAPIPPGRLNFICCLALSDAPNLLPVLSLSSQFYAWMEARTNQGKFSRGPVFVKPVAGSCLTSAELNTIKAQLACGVRELAKYYSDESDRVRLERLCAEHETDMKAACAVHALRRARNDTLASLKTQIYHLEIQLSVLEHKSNAAAQAEQVVKHTGEHTGEKPGEQAIEQAVEQATEQARELVPAKQVRELAPKQDPQQANTQRITEQALTESPITQEASPEHAYKHAYNYVSTDTWLTLELKRKAALLAELAAQETALRNEIAQASLFEVSEPYRGIIRQSEFNVKSLRRRLSSDGRRIS